MTVGSNKADLQEQTLAIFLISLTHCIHIEPEWIPRKENEVADYLSQIVDYDDWSLDHNTFMELDRAWGPHTIDRFATFYNTQLPCFNSTSPGAGEV